MRITKWLLLLFVLLLTNLFGQAANAQTINAASCSATDVQNAFNSVVASTTTVNIPACPSGFGWATQVTLTVPSGSSTLSVIGAGSLTTTGGSDQTVITDNYASNSAILAITTGNTSSYFRLAGITFQGGSGLDKENGIVQINGNSQNVRVDHDHFDAATYNPANASAQLNITGCIYGVMDHSIVDAAVRSVNNGVRIYTGSCNGDSLGVGNGNWAAATGLGSSNFFFVENNMFNNGAANDCTFGGRFVWRYNTMNMTAPAPSIQTHPTAGGNTESGSTRGCRAWEIYNNTFNAQSGNYMNTAFFLSSGTGVFWGNTLPSSSAGGGTGYGSMIQGHEMRVDDSTYANTTPPNGWGYCGTAFNGTGSAWDGNTSTTTGYPCLDQIGRGVGQLLVNEFPNTRNNSIGTIAWPNQALEPVYEWADAYSPVPNNPSLIWNEVESPLRVTQNQDYYLGTTNSGTPITFNGTSGVGSGLLSARPSVCTPLVAYWATDTQTLYQCRTTNTWSTYYTPYIYPHPLTLGSGTLSAPAPPSNVQATVQ